eukprot:9358873-Alexandrium_andersonii.AAC.1
MPARGPRPLPCHARSDRPQGTTAPRRASRGGLRANGGAPPWCGCGCGCAAWRQCWRRDSDIS